MNHDDGFRWVCLIALALLATWIYSDIRERKRAEFQRESLINVIDAWKHPKRPCPQPEPYCPENDR